jgi:hypothetical protein
MDKVQKPNDSETNYSCCSFRFFTSRSNHFDPLTFSVMAIHVFASEGLESDEWLKYNPWSTVLKVNEWLV